jgi:hypothetical protein
MKVLPEELAIWVIIGVALLLVGTIIQRGEAMPKVETSAHENRPDYQNFDERVWLALNRHRHDGGSQPIGPPSQASLEIGNPKKVEAPTTQASAEVGPTTERPLPLLKIEAADGSSEAQRKKQRR